MARTRVKVRTTHPEVMRILNAKAREDAKARKELLLFSRKVQRYWKRIAPVGDSTGARYEENFGGPLPKHWQQTDPRAGSYKAGIVNRKGRPINGFPSRVIAATDYKSHWIEYGTGGKTPTPEFACRQRTATRFGAMTGVRVVKSGVNKKDRKVARNTGVTSLEIGSTPSGRPARKGSGYEDAGAA